MRIKSKKIGLLTGVSGQDGSYLSELLLEKDYKVYGMIRKKAVNNFKNLVNVIDNPDFEIVYGDMQDETSLYNVINKIKPDEIYNLAAMSFVHESFNSPFTTIDINGLGALRILECIRKIDKSIKIYQASTSEMFGNIYSENLKSTSTPYSESLVKIVDENTPFNPVSPYGYGKLMAHYALRDYRKSYNIFGCSGMLFNHESPRRGEDFVTQKIIRESVKIKHGLTDYIGLGSLDAVRDWGYAPEYVSAMYLMMQHKNPGDYIIATGKPHTVLDFVKMTFSALGLKYNDKYIKVNEKYKRPIDVYYLCGNARKANDILGWEPKVDLKTMIKIMIKNKEEEIFNEVKGVEDE